jgi:alkanesulfonate monooxygenase SsuD/methylene tetrahydromethanopterin reductase-like flavin-dependent oxidoreductase (luciferase family)
MMKHRIKGLIGGGAATMAERSIHAYQEAAERARLNYKLGEGLSLGIFFHLADSRERRRARDHAVVRRAREDVRAARLRARAHSSAERGVDGTRRLGRRRVPTVEDYMKVGAWFAGTPEQFVAHLRSLEANIRVSSTCT